MVKIFNLKFDHPFYFATLRALPVVQKLWHTAIILKATKLANIKHLNNNAFLSVTFRKMQLVLN